MKKLLSVILVIAMIAVIGAFSVDATSYSINCTGETSFPYWAHGGSCFDVAADRSQANAWGKDPSAWNSVELEYTYGGEWFAHGINQGDIADVYSSVVSSDAATARNYFSYYVWGNYARK